MVMKRVLPGALASFAAMVLLLFVSISSPTWEKVSFLNVGEPGGPQIRYGVFGYTGHGPSVGYDFTIDSMNTTILHNLTKTLILHPIACGLAGLAFIFGVLGATGRRSGTGLMTLFSGLAMMATLVAFVIDMVLFGIGRTRYRNLDLWAQYGNANWLTLGALVALMMSFCLGACGALGHYRDRDRHTVRV